MRGVVFPARAQVWLARRGCPVVPTAVAGTRRQLAANGPAGPLRVLLPLGTGPHRALGLHSSPAFCFHRLEQETKSGDLSRKLFLLGTRALLGVNNSHLHNVISLVFFRPYLRLCSAPLTAISSCSAELQHRRTETRFSLCRFIPLSVNDTVLVGVWICSHPLPFDARSLAFSAIEAGLCA